MRYSIFSETVWRKVRSGLLTDAVWMFFESLRNHQLTMKFLWSFYGEVSSIGSFKFQSINIFDYAEDVKTYGIVYNKLPRNYNDREGTDPRKFGELHFVQHLPRSIIRIFLQSQKGYPFTPNWALKHRMEQQFCRQRWLQL